MELNTDRLTVIVDEPGKTYAGARFDWTGICSQITLDGCHTFCTVESGSGHVGSKGIGLCNEFGISTSLGYDEVEAGGSFVKIGIGYLQRVDERPHWFGRPFPVTPHPIETFHTATSAVFYMRNFKLRQYDFNYRKRVEIAGNTLTVTYAITNNGQVPLVTEEYAHNFFCIDGREISSDYEFEASFPIDKLATNWGPLAVQGSRVRFPLKLGQTQYLRKDEFSEVGEQEWHLVCKNAGARVRCRELFAVRRFVLWALPHVVSPECFVYLDVKPGQTFEWSREYTFEAL